MPKVITKTAVEIKGSVYQGGVPFEIDPYLYDSLVASGTTMILVEDQNKPSEQLKKQEDQKELFSDKNEQPSKVEEIQLEKEESVQIDNPEQDLKQSSGKKKK